MCNCTGNITSLCSRCSKGLMCQCPPDYSILPLPVNCKCCPAGYTFNGPTLNYPNGVCTGPGGKQVYPIPCTTCEVSTTPDCVFLPAIDCFGVPAGTTLLSFITDFMCSDAFVLNLLQRIGLSVTLKAALCEIVSICPSVGGTTPIIGPIVVTVP